MRSIPISSSVLKFWQDLVFLEAALLADDGTKHLAAVITPVLDEFPAILQQDLDTRRGVIQASARAFVADARIDDVIRGLFSAVLALVQQNRKRQEFTTLFPTHIGDVVRHALRKQIDVAKELADKSGRGKAWADGFFPRVSAVAAEEEGDDAAPEPAAPEESSEPAAQGEPAGKGKPK